MIDLWNLIDRPDTCMHTFSLFNSHCKALSIALSSDGCNFKENVSFFWWAMIKDVHNDLQWLLKADLDSNASHFRQINSNKWNWNIVLIHNSTKVAKFNAYSIQRYKMDLFEQMLVMTNLLTPVRIAFCPVPQPVTNDISTSAASYVLSSDM